MSVHFDPDFPEADESQASTLKAAWYDMHVDADKVPGIRS